MDDDIRDDVAPVDGDDLIGAGDDAQDSDGGRMSLAEFLAASGDLDDDAGGDDGGGSDIADAGGGAEPAVEPQQGDAGDAATAEPEPEPEPEPSGGAAEGDGDPVAPLYRSRALIGAVSRKHGVDLSHYPNDAALVDGLLAAKRRLSERDEKATVLDGLISKYGTDGLVRALQAYEAGTSPGGPAQQQPQQQQPARPALDPSVMDRVTVMLDPETGEPRVVPKPGQPESVVNDALQFIQHRERVLNQIAADPTGVIAQALERVMPQAQQEIAATLAQHQAAASEQAAFTSWVQANKQYLWYGGRPEPGNETPYGRAISEQMDRLAAAGVASTMERLRLAYRMVPWQQHAPSLAAPQPAQAAAAQATRAHAPPQATDARRPPRAALHSPTVASRQRSVTLDDIIESADSLTDVVRIASALGIEV